MQSPPFKDSPVEVNQHLLFPSNIFDLLAEDHDCFLYEDIFKLLDTSTIEPQYSHLGQRAFHPRVLVAILIYAYSHGVFSSRDIQRHCRQDLAFMYIAQMQCPDFRVLSDFRKKHAVFFHDCFRQSVQLALALKLASFGHISLDGSKFKANTSRHKAMSYQHLREQDAVLTTQIADLVRQAERCDDAENRAYQQQTGYEIADDLKHKQQRQQKIRAAKKALEQREEALNPGQAIDGKKQISFADTDARIMGKKGHFQYSYNGQVSVDSDNQIILGQHLSQNANDIQEVAPALEALSAATGGQLPDKMSVDNGYMSGSNLEALENAQIDAYIATDRGEKPCPTPLDTSARKLVKADFDYHPETDHFSCPGGAVLVLKQHSRDGRKFYQAAAADCTACAFQGRCCQSRQGKGRTISTDDKEPLRQQMNEKMASSEGKEIYKKRKTIVEPVFGQIKNLGFKGFSVRGLVKAAGEFALMCATHNLKKMVKAMATGLVRPKRGNLVPNPV
uniref:IS1182 family transposase n=1 Tax=Marinobacterium profundum TaxID=1714300 RepID=UPI00082E9B9A|nr:IS1182 family transposase [Marinobacterium profundum]